MWMSSIIVLLVGVIVYLAYKRGEQDKETEVLESEVEANKERNAIRSMSDDELDDELSDHWK